MAFGVDFQVDRRGTIYRKPIQPDVIARRAPLLAATQWLRTTPTCSRLPSKH